MKKLLLGTLAGLLWLFAFSLGLSPFYTFRDVPAAIGCVLGGVALLGLGCTAAMAAMEKEDLHEKNDL